MWLVSVLELIPKRKKNSRLYRGNDDKSGLVMKYSQNNICYILCGYVDLHSNSK